MIAALMSGRLRINAGSAAVPKACHYLCDVSSDHVALRMFPLPQQSYSDDRLMEVVGRRSRGREELGNWEKVASLGDNQDRFMIVC